MQLLEEIKKQLEAECSFSASRSSGPGGQNVNKVNTRVELRFSVEHSQVFSDDEKNLLFKKLKNRINSEGELILASEVERSQLRNRAKVTALFYELVEKALTPPKKRIKTTPTNSSRLNRLESKKQMAEKKQRRKPPTF
ncbi:aminoacyl-tRNA hydrolase [Maribellus luteus]|uniref:Aminoacyl-tRNA hydrolase n=1 Tax=Maribellus luteus TaxID=2305463 RepID=A0A399T2Y5_9BACT|nr:alternative ribosome rescue aminoacyl-tRNA hydrolase ArfB [Maribellus luteus]RIJ50770.1 aminoacyl-tRNA hydrolase [Maribellus luteus]